jgi:cytochrome c2
MKLVGKSAAVTLALALAACGGNDEAADTAATDTTSAMAPAATGAATPVPVDTAAATPTPVATPAASATPSPMPTPTASATTAAAAKPAEFAQCSACHSTEKGKNGIGPSLAGIYGDKAATVPGYEFSEAMKNSGLTWNAATLDRFLADPKGVVPGTKMTFPGLKDAAKRKAVVDYLKSL